MTLVHRTWIDWRGRKTAVQVPEDAPEKDWGKGIILGPPDLTNLGLTEEVTTKLHNELFNRGVIRRGDARRSRAEVHAALQSALRIDAEHIIALFEENANA